MQTKPVMILRVCRQFPPSWNQTLQYNTGKLVQLTKLPRLPALSDKYCRCLAMKTSRRSVEEFMAGYYGVCTAGGMLSAGATHLAITPLDVLKVNMQVNPIKYNGIISGFSTLCREEGASALWRGWSGKLFGYGVQGGCRFGLYEYFKKMYGDLLSDQSKGVIFFLSSASAQVFADIALCPFEAVKVRVQNQPSFAKGLVDGFPKFYANEGFYGPTSGGLRRHLKDAELLGYQATP